MNNLEPIAEQVRQSLTAKDEAREKMLPLCRESIRFSGNAIRAVHRQEFEQAEELIASAGKVLSEAEKAIGSQAELVNTGMVRDAQKEYTEASVVLALVKGKTLPTPQGLGVDAAAYLNGLGEAAGEIRRYLLDSMRKGELKRGEELLTAMDDIYGLLVTIDYPDAITGGLRRTTDMVRGVLERTRSDLTLTIRQKELEDRIARMKPSGSRKVKAEDDSSLAESESTEDSEPELGRGEEEIYRVLDAWRNRRATEENISPNMIARSSWLKEIIRRRPTTWRDLLGIKGFGERRAGKYGKEIIDIINKVRR